MKQIITDRGLPKVSFTGTLEEQNAAIRELIQKEEFGFLPEPPRMVQGTVNKNQEICAGDGTYQEVTLETAWGEEPFAFPLQLILPRQGIRGIFVYISFPQGNPVDFPPVEEMVSRGFGLARVVYTDITSDDNDFDNGLAGVYYKGRERGAEEPGKIALWSWAMMRVVDYLDQDARLQQARKAMIGFSRLGKTALFAGLMDERFDVVIGHNSGCAGAGVNRGKKGEDIERITRVFPYWFNKNYRTIGKEVQNMSWDQHFLIAGCAPRSVYITSSAEDSWSDPISEYIGALAGAEVYEALGLPGLNGPDGLPEVGTALHDGYVAYHLRKGPHALVRQDWVWFMDYMEGIQ